MDGPFTGRLSRALALIALAAAAGCGSGPTVTAEALQEARARWARADVKDYNLEWIASGERDEHALVFVRDGALVQVRQVQSDGDERLVDPADAPDHGIDGLFRIIEADLNDPRSARSTFDPDPTLGYPRRYRREPGSGTPALSIDIVRIDTTPPKALPPITSGPPH